MAKVKTKKRDYILDLNLGHKHRAHEGLCPQKDFFFCSLRLENLQIDTVALNGTPSIELCEPLTFIMSCFDCINSAFLERNE